MDTSLLSETFAVNVHLGYVKYMHHMPEVPITAAPFQLAVPVTIARDGEAAAQVATFPWSQTQYA
jgi:hypothetical protein